jgi:hypothetical protein
MKRSPTILSLAPKDIDKSITKIDKKNKQTILQKFQQKDILTFAPTQ